MNIFDIPIITYHKVSSQKEFGLTTVTPEAFYNQIKLLAEQGYKTITFKEFDSDIDLPEKPIIISFDDTYKSVYENAFPIMKEFGYKGILFIISDYIGKRNDWEAYSLQRKYIHAGTEDISEMHKNGFEIGSHGKTHKFLPHLNNSDIRSELEDSKHYLEYNFNNTIICCCYPYGGYNNNVSNVAQYSGYKYGVGNIKLNNKINNQMGLQRRSIYSIDSLSSFLKKITLSSKININFLNEWVIQKGAFAGIIKNKYF